jgi:uncharacterized protein YtpQ (UPF0354 family)
MVNQDADEIPIAERAKEGERICKELMPALIQIELDGTVESLKLIDSKADQLRKIFDALPEAGETKDAWVFMSKQGLVLALGAYFGEVMRRDLQGGQWKASEEGFLLSPIIWDYPDAKQRLWPFQIAYMLLTGEAKKSLYEVWGDISKEYRRRLEESIPCRGLPIYPVLKAAGWPHGEMVVRRRLNVNNKEDPELPWIALGWDLPNNIVYVSRQDLADMGMSEEEEVWRAAMENLRKRGASWEKGEVGISGTGEKVAMLMFQGDTLAAERVLDADFMREAQRLLNAESILVGIPRRGVLMAINGKPPGLAFINFSGNVATLYKGGESAPITPLAFMMKDGEFTGLVRFTIDAGGVKVI